MRHIPNREQAKKFIQKNYGKISQRKMSDTLSVSPITVTRLVRELGITNNPRQTNPKDGPRQSNFFIFRNQYELFIGKTLK
jgi:hypothetical protein